MAVSFVLADAGRDVLGDALSGALNGGVLEILDGAVLLVTYDLTADTTVNGVVTLAAPGAVAATAAGDADTAIFYTAAKAATVGTANVGIGAAYTVNLDNASIASGQVVTLSSCVLTVPAGT